MTANFSMTDIAWKRIFIFLALIIIPNYLLMQVQIGGSVNDITGLITAVDLIIVLPIVLYFFGFKKRISWIMLGAFVLWGLLLANWIIPNDANAYMTYFNKPVIALEAGIIVLELVLFLAIVKRIPLLVKNYKNEKKNYYHFLVSFSSAIQNTFTFKNKALNKFKFVLEVLATDIAVMYYGLFSWKNKNNITHKNNIRAFTFHKDSEYLSVFIMIVHAMTVEVIAVHLLVAYYINPTVAWIFTILDIHILLLIISDYQAIRLSPVVLDSKGMTFQKGIRQYGFISWDLIKEVTENKKSVKEVDRDRNSITLGLHGLERKSMPYVIKLKEPIEIRQIFGFKKTIESIYVDMDNVQAFNETFNSYLIKVNSDL